MAVKKNNSDDDQKRRLLQVNHEFWKSCDFTKLAGSEYYKHAKIVLTKICEKLIRAESNVLDIGCGNGEFTSVIAKYCARVRAYDLSAALIDYAKSNFMLPNTIYAVADLEDWDFSFPDGQDAIFCMGVFVTLHNDEKIAQILNSCKNKLKNGGFLITRDTCAQKDTFTKAYSNGYFGCYRSRREFMKLFSVNGFRCLSEIELWNNPVTTNAYYIFQTAN